MMSLFIIDKAEVALKNIQKRNESIMFGEKLREKFILEFLELGNKMNLKKSIS